MDQRFKVVFGAMCAFFYGLCLSNAALGQTVLPDGKGKAELVQNCTVCHTANLVIRVKKTPADWRTTVDNMAARGTSGSKEDIDNVVLYLDTNFALDPSAPATATPSTTPSSTSATPAASNSPQTDTAKRVITQNGCLSCHRIDKQGTYTAPPLNGVGARRTPDEIRKSIVSPPPTLDPSSSLVRLTTADGTPVVGRILSQDDHNVRVIDASGEVDTYSKPTLHQFTIINTNPMPSFEGKITGDDLDNLVRYLSSLPSVDESAQK
jgi:putative heme-binding domain-containing protein